MNIMPNNPISKLLAVLVIFFINFFLIITHINHSTSIQQELTALEKKITLEQSKQIDQDGSNQATIQDEIQRKLKTGDIEKVPSNEVQRLQDYQKKN